MSTPTPIVGIIMGSKSDWETVKIVCGMLDELGIEYIASPLLSMVMPDEAGSLAKFSRRLSDAGVNINSIYILSKHRGDAELVFSVDDMDKARQTLNLHEAVPP